MAKAEQEKVPLFHSIQTKFALSYIVVIAAVLVLLNSYPILISQNLVFESKQSSMKSQAAMLSSALAVSETLTAEGVEQAMSVLDDMGLTRIIVTDPAGLILYDTLEGGDTLSRYALFGEIVSALEGYDIFRSEYRDGSFRSRSAAPVVYRGITLGAVYLYEEDDQQGELLLDIQSTLRNISLVICAVVLALSAIFSKILTRRIGDLLRAIRIVREGEYSHRIRLSGRDELSQLAGEFNQLTGRLQTTEEARRRFVSDASHELKTPLASIRLLTDSILQSEQMDRETTLEFVSDIGGEADRLTRISEKLLALTRLDAALEVETGPVDVKQVVEKVCHMLEPLAQAAQVRLVLHLEEGGTIRCTTDDLYRVVFNLVENAIKYNLPGGEVILSLQAGERIQLVVEDTGVGIPEDDLSRIFDRFYRVDKARSRAAGGTGLGLSIVRDTVYQYGGSISVQPRQPEGTRFTVLFPPYVPEGGEEL